ncbi:lysozyme family protein [Aeromonas veronii]|uniref:hypothetical protein n=1 Tax=Aeromonas veronii TaxID=654 RepID=UPI000B27A397|nr:hypothetical protein [Aeromonas veronii]
MRLLILLLFIPVPALAQKYIEIPDMYFQVSQEKNVPADLLFAITLVESNLKTNKGRILPWPWTVNHRGTPYRFATRQAMYDFCAALVEKGDYSFDVGGAQVNWYWHSNRFSSLWSATDPLTNLRGAGDYLRENFNSSRDWWYATGKYHNPTDEERASSYRAKVKKIWSQINSQRKNKHEK